MKINKIFHYKISVLILTLTEILHNVIESWLNPSYSYMNQNGFVLISDNNSNANNWDEEENNNSSSNNSNEENNNSNANNPDEEENNNSNSENNTFSGETNAEREAENASPSTSQDENPGPDCNHDGRGPEEPVGPYHDFTNNYPCPRYKENPMLYPPERMPNRVLLRDAEEARGFAANPTEIGNIPGDEIHREWIDRHRQLSGEIGTRIGTGELPQGYAEPVINTPSPVPANEPEEDLWGVTPENSQEDFNPQTPPVNAEEENNIQQNFHPQTPPDSAEENHSEGEDFSESSSERESSDEQSSSERENSDEQSSSEEDGMAGNNTKRPRESEDEDLDLEETTKRVKL